jgi:hypothetical protein
VISFAGPPGDDLLDRGVATPEHWSVAIRSGGETAEDAAVHVLDEDDDSIEATGEEQ